MNARGIWKQYSKKISRTPREHSSTGRMSFAGGDMGQAISDFQTVLKTSPRYALAHYFLGLAYMKTGDTAQAMASLKEALKLDPNLKDAELNLAAG